MAIFTLPSTSNHQRYFDVRVLNLILYEFRKNRLEKQDGVGAEPARDLAVGVRGSLRRSGFFGTQHEYARGPQKRILQLRIQNTHSLITVQRDWCGREGTLGPGSGRLLTLSVPANTKAPGQVSQYGVSVPPQTDGEMPSPRATTQGILNTTAKL